MTKVSLLILAVFLTATSFAQQANNNIIRLGPTPIEIDEATFFLKTKEETIELDSIELRTLNPNWIKSINVVRLVEGSENDHTTSNYPSTENIYIELKRRYLKKYLNQRKEKNNDI